MISAGEVGAVFKIVNEASPVLKALMDEMNALQGVIDRTKLALKDLTFPPGLNRSIANMDRALQGVATQAENTAKVTQSGFEAIDRSVGRTAALVGDLKREMRGIGPTGGGFGSRGSTGRQRERSGLSAEAPAIPLPYGPPIRPSESSGGFWEMVVGAITLDGVKHFLAGGGELETQKKLLRDILGKRGTEGDIAGAVGYSPPYVGDMDAPLRRPRYRRSRRDGRLALPQERVGLRTPRRDRGSQEGRHAAGAASGHIRGLDEDSWNGRGVRPNFDLTY